MSHLIKYFKITLCTREHNGLPLYGYAMKPNLEVKDGFAILRDEKQISAYGIPLSLVDSYAIQPVFCDEDSDKQ
ncbi:Uncharacterised protein [Yersinia intermedia]|nr:Uncharacterised protein [Yersinia intermedia]